MRRRTWLGAAGIAVVAAAVGGAVAVSGAGEASPAAQDPRPATASVEHGSLSAVLSLNGTLTHRARPDGTPYSVVSRASGIYTDLPEAGDEIGCGDVLLRVDDVPVLLLCGAIPAFRDLRPGDVGRDVRQLNRNLDELGYDARAGVRLDRDGDRFTWRTQAALARLQDDRGLEVTGALDIADAIFLPGPVRIARVSGRLGGSARPGSEVAQATSATLLVQVDLEASQQGEVEVGDRAQITLPGNRSVRGRVDRLGSVARVADEDQGVAAATIPAFIRLDRPGAARGLDAAPVGVEIATDGVRDALSVPVTALVGREGGGFAVEVVRPGRPGELVAVDPGLFDTTRGRVQVEGDLAEGDRVVVPSP